MYRFVLIIPKDERDIRVRDAEEEIKIYERLLLQSEKRRSARPV